MEGDIEEKKEGGAKESQSVSLNFIFTMFAVIALGLLVLAKILTVFGVWSTTVYGIIFIIVFALTIIGGVFSFLSAQKPNFEFYANLFVLSLAIIF